MHIQFIIRINMSLKLLTNWHIISTLLLGPEAKVNMTFFKKNSQHAF